MPNTLVAGNRNDDTRFDHLPVKLLWRLSLYRGTRLRRRRRLRAKRNDYILVFIFFDIIFCILLLLKEKSSFFALKKSSKKKTPQFFSLRFFFACRASREKKITRRTTICRSNVRSSSCRSWRASSRRSSSLDRRAGFIYPASRLRVRRVVVVFVVLVRFLSLRAFV